MLRNLGEYGNTKIFIFMGVSVGFFLIYVWTDGC